MKNKAKLPFYPSREHSFYRWFFTVFTLILVRFSFKQVYIKSNSELPQKPLVCFSNHSYWWDALLPLVLNKYFFKRNARAMMEDTQMKKHSFFSRIGCFSVNLNGYNIRRTLTYARDFLSNDGNLLFLYPHGKMHSPENIGRFKNGITWILSQSDSLAFPVAYFIANHRFRRPELYISIGIPLPKNVNLETMELALKTELGTCVNAAFSEDDTFKPFL